MAQNREEIDYLVDRYGNRVEFQDKVLRNQISEYQEEAADLRSRYEVILTKAEEAEESAQNAADSETAASNSAQAAAGSAEDAAETAQDLSDLMTSYTAHVQAQDQAIADNNTAQLAVIDQQTTSKVAAQVAAMQVIEGQTVIDGTLTVSGAAADAKASGDQITELKNDLSGVHDAINGAQYMEIPVIGIGAGAIRATAGTVSAASTLGYTDYVDISDYKYLQYNRINQLETTTNLGVAFYDENKTYVTGVKNVTGSASLSYEKTIERVPQNAKFMRLTYILTQGAASLELAGNSPLFLAYNKINALSDVLGGQSLVLLTIPRILKNHFVAYANGRYISNANFNVAYRVNVTGLSRLFYKRITLTTASSQSGVAFYDSNNNYISGISSMGGQTADGYTNYYGDVPSNAAFADFTFFSDSTTYGTFEIYGEYARIKNEKFENLTNKFISNGYIATNVNVGDPVDINTVVTNGTVSYLITPCKIGDLFYVQCRAGEIGLPWCFIDTNYKLVSKSDSSITVDTDLTAPCNGFLIVNCYTRSFRCVYKSSDADTIRQFIFPPYESPSYYDPVNDTAISSVMPNTDEVEPTDVYALYDALMTAYPDIITRTTLPYKDQSGTYDIFCYTFNVPESYFEYASLYKPKGKPVVIIGSGLHGCGNSGDDHTMIGTLYLFLKDMLENWKESDALSYLRNNFIFKIIPLQNPWGQKNKNRQNSNGVDINRNMPFGWYLNNDPSIADRSGTEPLSENESKNLAHVIETTENACLYIDLHARIGNVPQNRMFYASIWQMSGFAQAFDGIIYDVSRKWETMSNDMTDQDVHGFVANNTYSVGMVSDYAYPNRYMGLIYEGFSTFSGYTGTRYDATITKMNLSYLGTVLLRLLNYIKTYNIIMLEH